MDSKKQKKGLGVTQVEEEEEGISQLHDSLLIHILSLLPTMDALRTCILSKRWRYLWNSLYNFDFSLDMETESSLRFVDYVLNHAVTSKVKEFQLECYRLYPKDAYAAEKAQLESRLSRCLRFAAERKVENVVLITDPHPDSCGCTLPGSFYTCSSMVTLSLYFFCFDSEAVIDWKALKSIKLEYVALSDEDMVNLLSGCPALETMELSSFKGFSLLEIHSSKLKTLKLKDYFPPSDLSDHSLEIIAPYLQHLEISGDHRNLKCRLVNVSSVVNVELTFYIMCIKDIYFDAMDHVEEEFDVGADCRDYHQVFRNLVPDNLQKLCCATKLTIGTWFTQVLHTLLLEGVAIPELKSKYLTLQLDMKRFDLYGVAGLLRVSPYVEKLNIDMKTMQSSAFCHFESQYLAEPHNVDSRSWISSFEFPNLRHVKIASSKWLCSKDLSEQVHHKLFKLSALLLKNATNLEKFIIVSKTRECRRCSMNCASTLLFQLAEQLLDCHRSSNSAIIFQEGDRIREMTSCGVQVKQQAIGTCAVDVPGSCQVRSESMLALENKVAALEQGGATLRAHITKLEDELKAERETQAKRHQELITLLQNLTPKPAQP